MSKIRGMINENELEEMHFAVDVPPSYSDRQGNYEEWINVEYFKTKQEAIDFAKEHFNADAEGRVSLISSF